MMNKQWRSPSISVVSLTELKQMIGALARSCWFKFGR